MNIQATAGVTAAAAPAAAVSPTSTSTGTTTSAAAATAAATTAASAKASEASGGSPSKSAGAPPSGGSSTASKGLVQTANGEYTSASVEADEKDAMALGLTLQKDGNYAVGTVKTIETSKNAAATSTAAIQAALNTLTLGG